MSVSNGQPGNADTFNNALASKTKANTFTGIQTLNHSGSGDQVTNVQALILSAIQSLGFSSESDPNKDTYDETASNLYAVANGQNRKVAIKALDAALKLLDGRTQTLEAAIPQSNYEATTDPLVTDDDSAGYLVGSEWYNSTSGALFLCVDNTTGEAVWVTVGSGDSVETEAMYLGDPETDGTWRIVTSGNNLSFERRESGVWTWKNQITP